MSELDIKTRITELRLRKNGLQMMQMVKRHLKRDESVLVGALWFAASLRPISNVNDELKVGDD